MDYLSMREWLSQPTTSILMILFIGVSFFHARLGLQEVAIDYISDHATRTITFIAITFGAVILSVAGIFSVLRIALAG